MAPTSISIPELIRLHEHQIVHLKRIQRRARLAIPKHRAVATLRRAPDVSLVQHGWERREFPTLAQLFQIVLGPKHLHRRSRVKRPRFLRLPSLWTVQRFARSFEIRPVIRALRSGDAVRELVSQTPERVVKRWIDAQVLAHEHVPSGRARLVVVV